MFKTQLWWNCDWSGEKAYLRLRAVTCRGEVAPGVMVAVGERACYTDENGFVFGIVPANRPLKVHFADFDTTVFIPYGEVKDLGTFDVGWGAFQAFGLLGKSGFLTVYVCGETDSLEYSLDGETWQMQPTFFLPGVSLPPLGWARRKDCATLSFRNYSPELFNNCRLLDAAALAAMPYIVTPTELITAQEAVYKISLKHIDILAIAPAAMQQHCVQYASLRSLENSAEECLEGLNLIIGHWTNLQSLDLSYNYLKSLPESLANLNKLQLLYLGFNELDTLPEWLVNLTNLGLLDLTGNGLRELPEWLTKLPKLKGLNLSESDASFIDLSKTLGDLTNLEGLSLNKSGLKTVPNSISRLTNLRSLNLSTNPLTSLPEFLGNLVNLRELNLENVYQVSLPDTLGNLTNLYNLNLSNVRLDSLPEWLGKLTNLQYLNLSNVSLDSVPEWIGNLTNLKSLRLTDNYLTSLPEALSNLTNLQTLALGSTLGTNKLKSVPEWIGNLTDLQKLYLDGNKLTTLPPSFANLADTLDTLTLRDNPISSEEQARIRAMLPKTTIYF